VVAISSKQWGDIGGMGAPAEPPVGCRAAGQGGKAPLKLKGN